MVFSFPSCGFPFSNYNQPIFVLLPIILLDLPLRIHDPSPVGIFLFCHYYFYILHINIRASPPSASVGYSFIYILHFTVTSGAQLMAIWPYLPFSFSYVKELSCISNTSVFVLPLRCKFLCYTYHYLYSFIVVSLFHFQYFGFPCNCYISHFH